MYLSSKGPRSWLKMYLKTWFFNTWPLKILKYKELKGKLCYWNTNNCYEFVTSWYLFYRFLSIIYKMYWLELWFHETGYIKPFFILSTDTIFKCKNICWYAIMFMCVISAFECLVIFSYFSDIVYFVLTNILVWD